MSLPTETKFPCAVVPRHDWMEVNWALSDLVRLSTSTGRDEFLCLDRAQVEYLRDQLTEWLEVTK